MQLQDKELALWKEVLEAAGHSVELDKHNLPVVDNDRQDYHSDIYCKQCHDAWCIYCIDIERNSDLIEPCEPI